MKREVSICVIMSFKKEVFKMPTVLEIEKEATLTTGKKREIKAKIRRLRSLLDDDEKEQRETYVYLKKVLDEDRPSNRRLFK